MEKIVIGIDYGTDSCRGIAVDCSSGMELASYTSFYSRWKEGLYCDSNSNCYRQHPKDYIESLEEVIKGLLENLSESEVQSITALGIDTTGSTPCLTDLNGTPLALLPEFEHDPDAMFVLWKDHTAIREAEEINVLAKKWEIDYTVRSGGTYSPEWFWSKALHLIRSNEKVRSKAYSIIEHCDWMPALLTGRFKPEEVKRSRCAAGHKGMWAAEWGGYPSQRFLSELDPLLNGFASRLSSETYTSDQLCGKITKSWSERLGLPSDVDVSIGIIDAHAGAIGAGIGANKMVKIIGTSTCDIVVTQYENLKGRNINGISGQVDGSVIPGYIGLEAGQSAFGDVYAWLRDILTWSVKSLPEKNSVTKDILSKLSKEASQLEINESDMIANDWFNGRRTPFNNPEVKGGLTGLNLGTTPSEIFKSLVEATAFGSRAIMEHLVNEGVEITEVIGVGGISLKSPYVMQILSDIMGIPIKIAKAQQAGALGVTMCAATAKGLFESVEKAQLAMAQGILTQYTPREEYRYIYDKLYLRYKEFCSFLEL